MAYVGQNPKFNNETLRPQSADPTNPGEGMVFRSDGTSRAKGIWQYKDGNWQVVDSNADQYLKNQNFDNVTTGWVTYADAAGTSPVDGIGGSPNITLTSSSSTPIRGAGSGIITKDAANRQGQGISTDFTIDNADKGTTLQGYFEYNVASGTFATGDITVWIYDITNGNVIACTPSQVTNSSSVARLGFEFTTVSTSGSYRLILHIGTTSALAYTLKIDNFNVYKNERDGLTTTSPGMVLLATTVASTSATVDFTSLDTINYTSFMVVGYNVIPVAGSGENLLLRFSNAGSFAAVNYGWQSLRWTTTVSATSGQAPVTAAGIALNSTGDQILNTGTNVGIDFTLTCYNLGNAVYTKKVNGQSYYLGSELLGNVFAGVYQNTAAVDGIRFLFDGGNIASGTFKLYGLR
jgi:hypothetical protein